MDSSKPTIRIAEFMKQNPTQRMDSQSAGKETVATAKSEHKVTEQPLVDDHQHQNPAVLTGEVVAFTGTLASMTHEQAFEQVAEYGGRPVHHVSRQMTMLVIGEEGWPLEEDGNPSVKWQQAETLFHQGIPIRIVSESDWLRMIDLQVETPEVKRLYTPAMLSQLLGIPVHIIRGWERAGLIRAQKKVFRLPYFSYHEVTTARRLSQWLQSGASQDEILRSLNQLKKYVPDPGRIFQQLELLADQHRLVIKDEHGYVDPKSRQRLFAFDEPIPSESNESVSGLDPQLSEQVSEHQCLKFEIPKSHPQNSHDWMVEGCRLAEVSDITGAIRCFRLALRNRPNDAEAHFYLADMLYRLGKQEAALERYWAAIEHDPQYLEAWTQIGCVYVEMRKLSEAVVAFESALEIHPAYAEAHLHLAETLQIQNKAEEARPHWQAYLQYDQRGPWAELAYQRLDQFGTAINPTP